jgi:hypothetical protein
MTMVFKKIPLWQLVLYWFLSENCWFFRFVKNIQNIWFSNLKIIRLNDSLIKEKKKDTKYCLLENSNNHTTLVETSKTFGLFLTIRSILSSN